MCAVRNVNRPHSAADDYSWEHLAGCTMVSPWEPCAMCAGTIYWARISAGQTTVEVMEPLTEEGMGGERSLRIAGRPGQR